MTSRFLQMFKRGRYVSTRLLAAAETDEATRKARHEERERFSVAAIAFCIQHDKAFKHHFLSVVAGLSPKDITSVTVEPEYCADLLLEGARRILVLEFKLGALLQDNQSPESRIFSETGYGAKIRRLFTKPGKELRYIVIGKNFEPCDRDGLQCTSIPWPKLLIPYDQESTIERDLYDCLGQLGAPVFLYRHMKNRKLATEAKSAMTVYGILKHVLACEAIREGSSDSNETSIGLNIPKAGATAGTLHGKLVELVQPKGNTVGWIGYETVEDVKLPHLSVYFYCTPETARKVRQRLKAAKGLGRIVNYDSTICILSAGDDTEWFARVLKTAGGN